jgi:hypothetical protein
MQFRKIVFLVDAAIAGFLAVALLPPEGLRRLAAEIARQRLHDVHSLRRRVVASLRETALLL